MTLQPQSISSALQYLTYASQMLSMFIVPLYSPPNCAISL